MPLRARFGEPQMWLNHAVLGAMLSGGGGIRTHGALARPTAFKTRRLWLNHQVSQAYVTVCATVGAAARHTDARRRSGPPVTAGARREMTYAPSYQTLQDSGFLNRVRWFNFRPGASQRQGERDRGAACRPVERPGQG